MKVRNLIDAYKINDKETAFGEEKTVWINSVWNSDSLVEIVFPNGNKVEVPASCLLNAVKNATNRPLNYRY